MSSQTFVQSLEGYIQTLSSQFPSLIHVYAVKHINTGDRVIDGAISVIINTLVLIIGTALFHVVKPFLLNWMIGHKFHETDDPCSIDHQTFDYSKYSYDTVSKFKHQVDCSPYNNMELHVAKSELEEWMLDTFVHLNGQTQLRYFLKTPDDDADDADDVVREPFPLESHVHDYFMPVWKYRSVKTGEWEYIWVVRSCICSDNFKELTKLCAVIRRHVRAKREASKAKAAKNKSTRRNIYEVEDMWRSAADPNGNVIRKIGEVNRDITFDVLHFDSKDAIVDKLTKFKNQNLHPKGSCVEHKLGILLHGPPGTAKTATISAVANFMDRDILMVNCLNAFDLQDILRVVHRYQTSAVIAFDEFDHILSGTEATEYDYVARISSLKDSFLTAENETDKKSIATQMKSVYARDSLGHLLRFFDGVGNSKDRIVVATTNALHKINERLIRCGRFDVVEKLGFCSLTMFFGLSKPYFPEYVDQLMHHDESQQRKEIQHFLETHEITPVELINALSSCSEANQLINYLKVRKTCV